MRTLHYDYNSLPALPCGYPFCRAILGGNQTLGVTLTILTYLALLALVLAIIVGLTYVAEYIINQFINEDS